VLAGGEAVGEVTRAAESPMLEAPIALALVGFDAVTDDLAIDGDGEEHVAMRETLPFVEGSDRSARLPDYGEG
jgi:aminomethyltransferase